ncbi:MAG: FAD-dependent oxidoreductase [Sphingomicrobium sp.]
MTTADVLIVGSGHGGTSAAIALRQLGFEGTVAMVSADPDLPYERPPLSKDYLAGEKGFDSILLRPANFWSDKAIELIAGEEIVAVDPPAHRATAASGRDFSYGKLIWSAGGVPRRVTCDGHDLQGIHTIRDRGDVDHLRGELERAHHVVVIGGGYIGLEAAASLTKLGKHVTVFEAMDRLLARVAAKPISDFFAAEHRRHGVEVHLGANVVCLEGEGGRVARAKLADGTTIAADLVIVGIGIVPRIAPLERAGADCPNGVAVDPLCRTTLPDVYAIGDCALHRNRFAPDRPVRVESVQNAADQAKVVALDILGRPEPYVATPWFWSNQYDVKLQTVGLSTGYDDALVRGDPASGRFSVIYLADGAVIPLDCVNMVRDYVQGRALVENWARVAPERLTDPDVALKSLILQD